MKNVRERADAIGTHRYVSVFMMETLAGWVPTSPAMEVKVLFGRHIWEVAQHADILGKRAFELRSPKHYTRTPGDEYVSLLNELRDVEDERHRLAIFYEGLLPAIAARCRSYTEATDGMLDEPSVRIMNRITRDFESMRAESRERLEGAIERDPGFESRVDEWKSREAATDMVAPQSEAKVSNG